MMDKMFERLGIYDILGVLLSGICMTATTICLLDVFHPIDGVVYTNINPWHFLLISYIIGLLFQEATNFLQYWPMSRIEFITYRIKTLMCKANIKKYSRNMYLLISVEPKNNDHISMEKQEIDEIKEFFRNKYNWNSNEFHWNIAYNYCRTYMSKNGNTAKNDRDQALAAMARSLSLFCILATLIPIYGKVIPVSFGKVNLVLNQILPILLIFLSVFFYRRFRRFTFRRYISIFRFFLYHSKLKDEDQNKQQQQQQQQQ